MYRNEKIELLEMPDDVAESQVIVPFFAGLVRTRR
jgi:hypothetical protein